MKKEGKVHTGPSEKKTSWNPKRTGKTMKSPGKDRKESRIRASEVYYPAKSGKTKGKLSPSLEYSGFVKLSGGKGESLGGFYKGNQELTSTKKRKQRIPDKTPQKFRVKP